MKLKTHTHESYLRPEEDLVFVVLLPEDSLLLLLVLFRDLAVALLLVEVGVLLV